MSKQPSRGGARPPRRRLFDNPDAPPIPADLEKWEARGGLLGGLLGVAILIYFLEAIGLHLIVRVAVPNHKGHFKLQHLNLVPEFWIGVALAIGMIFAVYLNKRQLLAIVTIFEGLMLVSFGSQFDAFIPLPFVIFGVWLMLRASRRTRQMAAAGQDPRSLRAKAKEVEKGASPTPAASKRYTPPAKKKSKPQAGPAGVGIGRGGVIRGDLGKKPGGIDEEQSKIMRVFEGRKKVKEEEASAED